MYRFHFTLGFKLNSRRAATDERVESGDEDVNTPVGAVEAPAAPGVAKTYGGRRATRTCLNSSTWEHGHFLGLSSRQLLWSYTDPIFTASIIYIISKNMLL